MDACRQSGIGCRPRHLQFELVEFDHFGHRHADRAGGGLPRLRAPDDCAVPCRQYPRHALRPASTTAPALGPPDFQAYVEVFLGDRWYIFDPSGTATPMGFVRFGTGRDAADVAFATIFGGVKSQAPVVRAFAIEDASLGIVRPYLCQDALSPDVGTPMSMDP